MKSSVFFCLACAGVTLAQQPPVTQTQANPQVTLSPPPEVEITTGAGLAGVPPTTVVAILNGRPVTSGWVEAMVNSLPGIRPEQAIIAPRKEFLDHYSVLLTMAARAVSKGLDQKFPAKHRLEYYRTTLLAQAMIDREMSGYISDEDKLNFYNENRSDYAKAKVRLILIRYRTGTSPATATTRSAADAEKLANQVLSLARGGAQFTELVNKYSEDPVSKAKDGLYGEVKRTDQAAPLQVRDAVLSTESGKITEPVRLDDGFYIFLVDERGTIPYAEVAGDVEVRIRNQKGQNVVQAVKPLVEVKEKNFFNRYLPKAKQIKGASGAPVGDDTVVATLNGKPVTARWVDDMVRALPDIDPKTIDQVDRRGFLDHYSVLRQKADQAEKLSLDELSPLAQQLESYRTTLLADIEAEQESSKGASGVSPAAIQEYYDKNRPLFETAKVKLLVIRYSDVPAANGEKVLPEAEAKAKIEEIYKKSKAGSDFSQLVRDFSEDPYTKSKEGNYGVLHRNDPALPQEVLQTAFSLPVGGVSAPLKQPTGFYLLQVTERGVTPLAEAKGSIEARLRVAKSEELVKHIQPSVEVKNQLYFDVNKTNAELARKGAIGTSAQPSSK